MKGDATTSLGLIGLVICVVNVSCQRSVEHFDLAEQRGVAYLLSQQAVDGLWHSPNYGNLKDGAAITALVLYALSDASLEDPTAIRRAVDSLAAEIRENGYVTNPDGPDYTNYGSAMLLKVIYQNHWETADDLATILENYLLDAQLDNEDGFSKSNPDFGGWDLTGYMTGPRPTTGTNVSVTAEVLEALAIANNSKTKADPKSQANTITDGDAKMKEAFEKARVWIKRTRNPDGGFHFHPQSNHVGNKAGWPDPKDRSQPLSYGTATADGLRLLIASGESPESPSVSETVGWLMERPELNHVPGFNDSQKPGSWANGLRFYYYQSLSRSLQLFPTDTGQRIAKQIINQLEAEQHPNGSWTNENARMREDDPLIATSFAIIALQNCRAFLQQQSER